MKKWQIGLIGVLSVAALLMCTSLIVSAVMDGEEDEEIDPLISVYEERVNVLEGEIERLKAEQYLIKEDYEGKIEALEDAIEESRKKSEMEQIVSKEPELPKSNVAYTYTLSNGKINISGHKGDAEVLYIPRMIDGLLVSCIGREAFKGGSFSEIIIPDGVEKIDWFAFSNCLDLQTITIPKSVTKIEYGAFNGSDGITVACYKDSYAYKYAKSYGYNIDIIE